MDGARSNRDSVGHRFRAELADAAYQALLRLDRRKALGERLKAFTGILRGFKVGASVEGKVEFSFDPDR